MKYSPGDWIFWNKENQSGERIIRTPATFVKYTDQRCIIAVESKFGTVATKVVKLEFIEPRREHATKSTANMNKRGSYHPRQPGA